MLFVFSLLFGRKMLWLWMNSVEMHRFFVSIVVVEMQWNSWKLNFFFHSSVAVWSWIVWNIWNIFWIRLPNVSLYTLYAWCRLNDNLKLINFITKNSRQSRKNVKNEWILTVYYEMIYSSQANFHYRLHVAVF